MKKTENSQNAVGGKEKKCKKIEKITQQQEGLPALSADF